MTSPTEINRPEAIGDGVGVEELEDAAEAGWNACRRQVYLLSEDYIERTHALKNAETVEGNFYRGQYDVAKSFARAFNAFEARDCDYFKQIDFSALSSPPQPEQPVSVVGGWHDGAPGKPWADEWFIAETTYGDRVVLASLPEGWSYDFKTADDAYIKADRIKRWMQFPDSQYIPPATDRRDAPEPVLFVSEQQLASCIGTYLPTRKHREGNFQFPLYASQPSDAELVRMLKEALEPFAKAADVKLCGEWRDDERFGQTDVSFYLTFGDLRRARAALSAKDDKNG
ncbi:hypothetical protein [Rhizobium phage RHph_X2_28B]|uniref:hypothetical protein n=1 Tax=Rhizobium phage RHph_X2_28B TaxID=2836086 RepID=UPI0023292FE2|nr:hypothetical protein PP751_gp044 [Rhizobium phage RHph_X2_28B]QWY83496.1 hypothetical protein [Rhizobium phage RHph_X2_28B]QWY83732.1 hypothetical protein [Rhizobium phage RHph_X3_15]